MAIKFIPYKYEYGYMPVEARRGVLPERSVCSVSPADVVEDYMFTGNGSHRVDVSGRPYSDECVVAQEFLYDPKWKKTPPPPDLRPVLPQIRKLLVEGRPDETNELVDQAMKDAGYEKYTVFTPNFVRPPGSLYEHYAFRITYMQPEAKETKNYLRWLDMMTGKITNHWENERGVFESETFVCRITHRSDYPSKTDNCYLTAFSLESKKRKDALYIFIYIITYYKILFASYSLGVIIMPKANIDIKNSRAIYGRLSVYGQIMKKDFLRNRMIYFMALFGVAYYVIFNYVPMYGVIIAFKNFSPAKGIIGSPWIGFENFIKFFKSYYFWRILKNTILINFYELVWGFPAPIIFALLLNEIRKNSFKRFVQTATYLPHFISSVVICGIIVDFSTKSGFFNTIISAFGGTPSTLLLRPELFRTIFVGSSVWQGVGWGSIIYLSALSAIDIQLYDAAIVDGANRWQQTKHVTLPGILPIIVILLILRIGRMINVGFEKIILLYNPATYVTADVISSFVYRKGLLESDFSYSTAVGLFNSLVNFFLLIAANTLSRKVNETSLW